MQKLLNELAVQDSSHQELLHRDGRLEYLIKERKHLIGTCMNIQLEENNLYLYIIYVT